MATNFPTGLDDFDNYVDGTTIMEAALLNDMQFAIEALQAKVGIDSSGVSSSHDYKLAKQGIIQIVNTQTGAVATGSTALPHDDSIPQNTEGNEYMTLAITPTNASNKLKIDVVFHGARAFGEVVTAALFQDSIANALAASSDMETVASKIHNIMFTHYMTAGTTSVTTFKVRAGTETANTVTFNGLAGGRKLGGVMASSITITEIKV